MRTFVRKEDLKQITRMHSSRMRTDRSLTVCLGGGVNRMTDTSKNITLATTSLQLLTRIHSSWMHTGHSLTVSGGGVCFWSPELPQLAVGLDQIPLNFPLGCGPGDHTQTKNGRPPRPKWETPLDPNGRPRDQNGCGR